MTHSRPILLVDDSEDYVFFMQRALEDAAVPNPVFVAEDGLKAIEFLTGSGQFSDGTPRRNQPIYSMILR